MAVRLKTGSESDVVVIEFDERMDPESLAECTRQFDRIPRIWWKHVTVMLRGIDAIHPDALELLRHLRERASGCSLQLVDCQPEVSRTLEAAAFPRCFEPATGVRGGTHSCARPGPG
jgi:hypothetical protein